MRNLQGEWKWKKKLCGGMSKNFLTIRPERMTVAQFPLAAERCFELEGDVPLMPTVNAIPSACRGLSEKLRRRNCIKVGHAGWKQRMEEILGCPEDGKTTVL